MTTDRSEDASRLSPSEKTTAASTISHDGTGLPATDNASTLPGEASGKSAARTFPDVPGYEVLSELGHGGMGVVYLARQTSLKRLVALKMLRPGLGTGPEQARFQAEAEAIARLQHPDIVQVFEVGECPLGRFVALEYIEGGSLDRRLKQTTLEAREAAELAARLARAIHAAHGKGIVHRDLKPANVLLADPGDRLIPKVSDFGLAKFLDDLAPELTREGAVLGTPSYMAPEQAAGRNSDVGPVTDVYALGAILYECLTGRPPFKGANTRETLDLVCMHDPVPVRQICPGVSRDLETICLTCLHKEASKRYRSAADLADDLDRFLEGRPIAARPVGLLEKALKWARRYPAAAALCAVLFLTVTGAVVAGVLVNRRLAADYEYALGREKEAHDKEEIANRALDELKRQTEAERRATAYALLQQRMALAARNVGDAFRSLREFRSDEADRLLGAVDEDIRGWEWRLLHGYLRRSPLLVPGECQSTAFHPGGDLVAAGSSKGTVRIFNFSDLSRSREEWSWHEQRIKRLAYDPAGKWLAAGSDRGLLVVADAATGKEVFRRQGEATDTDVLTFTPDGRLLATGVGDGGIRFTEMPGGKERDPVKMHRIRVTGIAFLDAGRRTVSSSYDGTVKVWETQTGKEALKLQETRLFGFITCCATDPSGKRLAAADTTTNLAVWDAVTGKTVWTFTSPGVDWVRSLGFSGDGTRLFGQTHGGGIYVWDAASGRVLLRLVEKDSFFTDDLAVTPDGNRVAVAGSKGLKLWHIGVPLETFAFTVKGEKVPKETTFTADSRELCLRIGDGRFLRLDAATGKETFRRDTDGQNLFLWALAPGGRGYAGAGRDGIVRFFDAQTGAERARAGEKTGPLSSLAFSPDGRLLAAASAGGVVVFDAADGRVRHRFEAGQRAASGVAIDDTGRYLAAGLWERGVVVWDLEENRKAWEAVAGDGRSTMPVFRPGGKHLALACADNVLRVFSLEKGEIVFVLRGHTNSVSAVAYSPDGNRLASYGDRTVRIWDTETGQETLTFPVNDPFTTHLTFSPDSRRLAVTESMTIRVYDAPPP